MADVLKPSVMEKKKKNCRRQFGALPLRMSDDGRIEVMMVTSRETRRWIVPKGWPIKGLSGAQTAAREAQEEAGVLGITGKSPVGGYLYDKRLKNGSSARCYVELYPLWVVDDMPRWPEYGEREIEWLPVDQAAERAGDASLGELLRAVGDKGLPRSSHKLYRKAARKARRTQAQGDLRYR
ncbi:8-oxo-dGTP pyrophosphatase MutT (NUDIX family) [Pseudochelatococcus lubricantis]|uniref:8-oxo-dGTP pyrophosphatase MutT (NUDIX family) n=1 Tax=Pseudochelatococcus lubricantis TaxID=1538102 RepID=A0ABX0UXQ0_9HYPH|nr:NUDIX hydrolase [Pseudochelatococcus lubricantis]NIJ57683.1 8-oxo-dGTP pyrophosphatase MutT (NUDIX family) [Pseudochelatococcus lubricantis]